MQNGAAHNSRLTEVIPDPATRPARRTAAQIVLLGSFGLDLILYSIVVPFLPGEAQRMGATPLATGILFAMYAAGLFAATPLAAWLTDHIGPRRTLLWGLLALAASTLLFAFSPTLSLDLPGLFTARAAQGVASTLTWTAGLAIVVQLYTSEERSRIFARAFTVTGLAALIGPPLGGVLYAVGGFMLPFLVATGLALLDGLGRLLFLPSNATLPATRPEQGATRALFRDAPFRLGLFAAAAGALALSALEPVTPLLLGGSFGITPWGVGVVFGGLALCFVLIQPLVSRSERHIGGIQTIRIGLVVVALAFAGLGVVSTLRVRVALGNIAGVNLGNLSLALLAVFALLAVIGCALGLVLIPAPEILTRSGQRMAGSAGAAYGAIYASYNAAYALGILFGPLAAGGAADFQGVAHSYLLLALAPAICALILVVFRPQARPPDGDSDGEAGGAG